MNLTELQQSFNNKEIIGFKANGQKVRLFQSQDNTLCYYKKGSSRRGYRLSEHNLSNFEGVIRAKNVNPDKEYTLIAKYRREAMKAQFTNSFIQDCRALPESKHQWIIEGRKSLYEYHITTGNKIDGVVISFDAIGKEYKHLMNEFKQNLANKIQYSSGRYRFRGQELTLSVSVDENGNPRGYCAIEFIGCGNGKYYLAINNEKFIGYDVD